MQRRNNNSYLIKKESYLYGFEDIAPAKGDLGKLKSAGYIDWILKTFPLEIGGGGQMGKSMYAMRGS